MAGRTTGGRVTADRGLGVAGGVAGLAASLYVLFGPVASYERLRPDGTSVAGTVSGIDYLFGSPGADFALFAWPLLLGVVSALGALAAWHDSNRWTWAAALALAVFTVVGAFSIGLLYLPAAGLLLAAAFLGRAA